MNDWQTLDDIAPELAGETTFRVDDIARRFGIPRSTLYQWIKHGEIPALRFGRAVRLNRAAVELVLRKRHRATQQEMIHHAASNAPPVPGASDPVLSPLRTGPLESSFDAGRHGADLSWSRKGIDRGRQ